MALTFDRASRKFISPRKNPGWWLDKTGHVVAEYENIYSKQDFMYISLNCRYWSVKIKMVGTIHVGLKLSVDQISLNLYFE